MTRAEARKEGLKRYLPNQPCRRGHVSARYASSGECVECIAIRYREWRQSREGKPPKPPLRPHPRAVTTDFSYLTPAQVEAWYRQVWAIKPNSQAYKHHPLEERTILYQPPLRKVAETPK